jgi:FKBP-type peptidyl-prolyl cis-trans isomerase FklB
MKKISYALGLNIAHNLKSAKINEIDVDSFSKAIADKLLEKEQEITDQEAQQILNDFFTKKEQEANKAVIAEGAEFLAKKEQETGVVKLNSGLLYKVINEGNGQTPKATDKVKCHYEGTLIDGTVFDSSYKRGQAATFPVNGVIQGWVEALQLMKEGAKWELYIPYNLAYGAQGAGQLIGPYSTLIFTVELISIEK